MAKILQIRLLYILFIMIGTINSIVAVEDNRGKPSSDIRVLVDISGSMKLNDPENLRIPAVQLMSNLLPPDSQAGIWTFGEYVNMLVPLNPVDKDWKKLAIKKAKSINSLGMYTNIGDAMEHASFGWKTPDPSIKRSLILLTDGVVDISKDAAENTAARRKVLRELLPQYKAAGITIHTIALSGDADEKLLSAMASETDGWYQKVVNADELQKVFLKIFEQATERDSVPLKDNRFSIDEQIEEFTLLVFKTDNSKPTILEQPDGENYDASVDNETVSWFESPNYDLITINAPMAGEWRVYAEVDPDNRVLIVSNLKIKSTVLPNNLLANEKFNFNIHLLQEGEIITQQDFLKLLTIETEVLDANEKESTFLLLDDGRGVDEKPGDGIYSVELTAPAVSGVTQISAWVESHTFQRMRQQAVNIFNSPIVITTQLSEELTTPHKIAFRPVSGVSKASSLTIQIEAQLPDGQQLSLDAEFVTGYTLGVELPAVKDGGEYQLQLSISGETPAGRKFQVKPPMFQFSTDSIKEVVLEPVVEKKPVEEKPVEEVPEPVVEDPVLVEENVDDDNGEEETDMVFLLSIGLAVNLLLIIAGWLVAMKMKKKKLEQANEMTELLEQE